MKLLRQTILFCIWLAASALVQAAETAGEVVLAQGNAFLQREGTRLRIPVSAGHAVHAGDAFQTTDGGHLHIRLHDGSIIMLRPESQVIIDEYSFRPEYPCAIRVRLRLEEGVMRTITGEGIRNTSHRFRLNTPIAAIGVLRRKRWLVFLIPSPVMVRMTPSSRRRRTLIAQGYSGRKLYSSMMTWLSGRSMMRLPSCSLMCG